MIVQIPRPFQVTGRKCMIVYNIHQMVDIYLDFIIAYINLFSLHMKEGKSESSLMDESTTSSLGILNPSVIESQV